MKRRIIVVGGGIAGLAAVHRLVELGRDKSEGVEITLLEAGQRLGGVIATERVDDFLVEGGPDSFITEKPWALQLCERLGIAQRLISTRPGLQKIYVVHRGSLCALPEGFLLLAPTRFWPWVKSPLFSWRGKLRMVLDLVLPRRSADQIEKDESLASFVRRRLGTEVLERVAQPLIGGIYAADSERLSLQATMPRFLEMERAGRSMILGLWKERRRRSERGSGARWSLFVTPAGGMQELVDALARKLPPGTVRLGVEVKGVASDGKNRWALETSAGEQLPADGVILTCSAYRAARILSGLAPRVADELKSVSYVSTATVSLAYRREDVPHPLDGFGLVVPAVEARGIIACTFSSQKYSGRAPDGSVLLRAFVGGALQAGLFEQDDAVMERSVRRELADLLGVEGPPLFSRIYRHPRSMPQYLVGHRQRVSRIEEGLGEFPGIELAGSAYHGVGVADCVRSGEAVAERLLGRFKA